MKPILRLSAIILVLGSTLFLLIQLVPYGRSHQNPAIVQEPAWDSPQTRQLAQRACFDCHSNETIWPWYAKIAPVSWLVQRDVDSGREHLNFSAWTGSEDALREVDEVIAEGEMPPFYFVMMHPEASLSDAEKQQLIQGLEQLR